MVKEGKEQGQAGVVRDWPRNFARLLHGQLGGDWSASPVESELDDLEDEDSPVEHERSPTLWEAEVVALSGEGLFSGHDASEGVG